MVLPERRRHHRGVTRAGTCDVEESAKEKKEHDEHGDRLAAAHPTWAMAQS